MRGHDDYGVTGHVLPDDRSQTPADVTLGRDATSIDTLPYQMGSVSAPALGRRRDRVLRALVRETQAPMSPTLAAQAA